MATIPTTTKTPTTAPVFLKNGFPEELDVDAVSVAPTTAVTVMSWPLLVVRMTDGVTLSAVRLVTDDAAVVVGTVVGAVVVAAAVVVVGAALVVLTLVEVGTVLLLIVEETLVEVLVGTELEVDVEGWLVVLGGPVVLDGTLVVVGRVKVVVGNAVVDGLDVFEIVLDPVPSWRLGCISASNLSLNTGDMVVE